MAYVKKREASGRTFKWDACWDTRVDGKRVERSKTFDSQKAAKDHLTRIGLQKPSSNDPLKKLTDAYLEDYESRVKAKTREESSLKQVRQHVNLHIMADAEFAALKCGDIGTPEVQAFLDRLFKRVSPVMTVKVRNTLSHIFKFGSRRSFCSSNPVRETEVATTTRPEAGEAGETFILPPKGDLKRLWAASRTYDNTGEAEAIVCTLMFAGLRASEMRGLPVRTLSFDDEKQPKLRVDQRANQKGKIGPVKSKMSRRDIPLGEEIVAALKRWLEAKPDSDYVFPNDAGNVQSYQNLWNRFWVPLMNCAGLVTDEPASKTIRNWSEEQKDYKQPRFSFHMLRHVYASLQIEQDVKPKRLQALMGHATLKLTMDTYGHLWPSDDADKKAANVAKVLG